MLGAVSDAQSYQADSIVPLVSAEELRSSSSEYPQEVTAKYLSLPETLPQRVRDLAQSLTAGIENPYDRARAIEAYLREYPYTLDVPPPPPDRDVADYFLFDLKKGYCDYYATSMVVLARSAGLPARLVIGYANGVYDPNRAEYVVHEAEAHSWVEIYFTGHGWIEFEPTASELEITLPDQLPQETAPGLPAPDESFQAKNGFFPRWNPLPTAFGLAAATAAASVFWFFRTQGLWRVHKTIGSLYAYVYYHGRKIYTDAPMYETPLLFADNLSLRFKSLQTGPAPAVEEIRLLTDLYIQETYSAHPVTTDERSKAVKAWKRLFWRLLYARLTLRP
jgi:hypothetical protein